MNALKTSLHLASLLFFSNCSNGADPTGPFRDPVTIHLIVTAGETQVAMLLLPAPGQRFEERDAGVVSATISSGGFKSNLEPAPISECIADTRTSTSIQDRYCFSGSNGTAIKPGSVWNLDIRFENGHSVSGEAVVPSPPIFVEPLPNDHFRFSTYVDRWTRQNETHVLMPLSWVHGNAPHLELGMEVTGIFKDGMLLAGGACDPSFSPGVGTDLSSFADGMIEVTDFDCRESAQRGAANIAWDSLSVDLHLVKFDSAYSIYAEEVLEGGGVRERMISVGLEGASGVFAGAARVTHHVTIINEIKD